MITLQDICKDYPVRHGHRRVLENVSFTFGRGEKIGILGRNGAGKSTLIRLISGAELPTSGHVERRMSVSWPLAFGGAFQNALTGLDNVRFISRIYRQDYHHNIEFVREFTELGLYLHEPIRSYSQGMRARLAFAISMIIEFDCYLIDEISAVGDARFYEKCEQELFDKRGDRAMIIVSHDLHYIQAHCQRFAVLNEGRLVFHPTFQEAHDTHMANMAVENIPG